MSSGTGVSPVIRGMGILPMSFAEKSKFSSVEHGRDARATLIR